MPTFIVGNLFKIRAGSPARCIGVVYSPGLVSTIVLYRWAINSFEQQIYYTKADGYMIDAANQSELDIVGNWP